MSYEVNQREVESVCSLPPADRYAYFINKVADWEEVWSLRHEEGWALMSDDSGRQLIPVWPARAFAAKCCVAGWGGYHGESIALDDWLDKWTPGMTRDNRCVAVFPLSTDKGIVVTPDRLRADLVEAMEQYE